MTNKKYIVLLLVTNEVNIELKRLKRYNLKVLKIKEKQK